MTFAPRLSVAQQARLGVHVLEQAMKGHGQEIADVVQLEAIRARLGRGDGVTQREIDRMAEELQPEGRVLRPGEKDENLPLVDARGLPTHIRAPRWLCHLLGLRHTVVHVLLQWASPGLGEVFVFQVRSWRASVSPGHVDISIGGHLTESALNPEAAAYREMQEEFGLSREHLASGELRHVASYEWYEERPSENFYNSEWREVYVGDITPGKIQAIKFQDREVAGLYLCPRGAAAGLLQQDVIPVATALRYSLPRCLAEK